jgi:WD40 repeat protein
MRHITNIETQVAVNYCSTSLDGKYLAAVGDDTFILVFDIRSSYRNIFKLEEFKDGGFSCSFNSACNLLAAASQDGSVLVWDLRKIKDPLVKLEAKQKTPKGACRCLKFSPTNGVDLLAFSEHVNYFHLVDTRNFTDIQQIRVARYGDHDISGITFTNDSSKLFVGLSDEIQQYHVDINARRMFCFGNLL